MRERYQFIETQAGQYKAQMLCRVLQVSRSAYYHWKQQKRSSLADQKKKEMEQPIVDIFQEHRRRYGTRRIVAELKAAEVKTSRYKVRKVLTENGLKAIQLRSFVPRTTDSRHPYPLAPTYFWKERRHKDRMKYGQATSLISRWQVAAFFTWQCGWIYIPGRSSAGS